MKQFKVFILVTFACFGILTVTAFAHQPRIPDDLNVTVENPDVSKAYYSELEGEPHTYSINAEQPFLLYVNILVPDIDNRRYDFIVDILKDGDLIEKLDGTNFEWYEFFEPFGYDTYWTGPEFESDVSAGNYEIVVHNQDNQGKYSLAVGKIEAFDFEETLNAYKLIPLIKRYFFGESPANFIFSPLGWGLVVVMFLLAFVFGFIYRLLLRRLSKNKIRKSHKNIGIKDRLFRLAIAIVLFILAITTSWSPILLFFSGFTLFEAIFSWCGFYAAIGKNTCPV